MNWQPLSSYLYEVLHTMFSLCLGEVWCGNLREFCQELVILISGEGYCMEVRSRCGGYRQRAEWKVPAGMSHLPF